MLAGTTTTTTTTVAALAVVVVIGNNLDRLAQQAADLIRIGIGPLRRLCRIVVQRARLFEGGPFERGLGVAVDIVRVINNVLADIEKPRAALNLDLARHHAPPRPRNSPAAAASALSLRGAGVAGVV